MSQSGDMHACPQLPQSEPGVGGLRGLPGPIIVSLYVFLVLVPLGVAALSGDRLGSTWFELGAGFGLVAAALLVLQYLSSGRFELLSGRIGIDRTMGFHRIAAYLLLGLAILHPLSYTGADLLERPATAFQQLQGMMGSPRFKTGVGALILLTLVVTFATFRSVRWVRYELWRASHGLAAMAVLGLTLHHAITVGVYSQSQTLHLVWLAYALVAFTAAGVVYVVRPRRMWREDWRVESVQPAAEGVTQLVLRGPKQTCLRFRGGQFIWMTVAPNRPPFHDHPFSIASSVGSLPRVTLLVREAGDCTNKFPHISPGTPVAIDGPHGSFILPPGKGPVVMIAGGVGIAPLLGMLNEAADNGDDRPYRLLYATRNAAALAGKEELARLQGSLDLAVTYCLDSLSRTVPSLPGPVSLDHISSLLSGLKPQDVTAMLCGPPQLMEKAADALLALGLAWDRIHYERFDYGAGQGRIDRHRRCIALAILSAVPLAAILFSLR